MPAVLRAALALRALRALLVRPTLLACERCSGAGASSAASVAGEADAARVRATLALRALRALRALLVTSALLACERCSGAGAASASAALATLALRGCWRARLLALRALRAREQGEGNGR